jgi:hypothetical protein
VAIFMMTISPAILPSARPAVLPYPLRLAQIRSLAAER